MRTHAVNDHFIGVEIDSKNSWTKLTLIPLMCSQLSCLFGWCIDLKWVSEVSGCRKKQNVDIQNYVIQREIRNVRVTQPRKIERYTISFFTYLVNFVFLCVFWTVNF